MSEVVRSAAGAVSPGIVLRTLRERANLSTAQAAARARVSESYLSKVEAGVTVPTDEWLGYIAAVLADALMEGKGLPAAD